MGVPAQTLYPSDHLEYICQFGFDNLDIFDIDVYVGKNLHVHLPSSFWKPLFPVKREASEVSLGELVRFVAQNWESLSSLQTVKAQSKDGQDRNPTKRVV